MAVGGAGVGVAVLYRVEHSKVSHVWVGHDAEKLAVHPAEKKVEESRLFVGEVLEVLWYNKPS